MDILVKISGVILRLAGFVLVFRPGLFTQFNSPIEGYEMIEKRVKWGMLIGFGLFLIFFRDWTSWKLVVTGLLFALTAGIIIARLTGFGLDGFFTG